MRIIFSLFLFSQCMLVSAAEVVFEVKPGEVSVSCSMRTLHIIIPEIGRYTKSGKEGFGETQDDVGSCKALMKQLVIKEPTLIQLKTKVQPKSEFVGMNSCQDGKCSATFRHYLSERIELVLNEVNFVDEALIPKSEKLEKVYWGEDDCPPFKPDCDL